MSQQALPTPADGHRMLGYFDKLYGGNADPYGVRTRWYEARKRAILLASLPEPHYQNGFEPGCGNGELTVLLAPRCKKLLASDFSEDAVRHARLRTHALANVEVRRQSMPDEWPACRGPFDLVVLSELCYFLTAQQMAGLVAALRGSLSPHATVVACDWLPNFEQRAQTTVEVHAALDALQLPLLLAHEEADFTLRVWRTGGCSVAQSEQIR